MTPPSFPIPKFHISTCPPSNWFQSIKVGGGSKASTQQKKMSAKPPKVRSTGRGTTVHCQKVFSISEYHELESSDATVIPYPPSSADQKPRRQRSEDCAIEGDRGNIDADLGA